MLIKCTVKNEIKGLFCIYPTWEWFFSFKKVICAKKKALRRNDSKQHKKNDYSLLKYSISLYVKVTCHKGKENKAQNRGKTISKDVYKINEQVCLSPTKILHI